MIYLKRNGGLGQYLASPVVAGKNLILISEEGLVSVVRTGKVFELLGQLHLKVKIRVTPALGINNLYLRTESHLWAFGKMSKRP